MENGGSRTGPKNCQKKALTFHNLVQGIDDFAIRKGHMYNMGLLDLCKGTFLDAISRLRIEELQAYLNAQSALCVLKPVAIVLDLAKAYYMFAENMYPVAILIAVL